MKLTKRGDITFYEADYSQVKDNALAWGLILVLLLGITFIIAAHFKLHLI